eukprot:PhM_4_TR18667/c0_g1_i1/m.19829
MQPLRSTNRRRSTAQISRSSFSSSVVFSNAETEDDPRHCLEYSSMWLFSGSFTPRVFVFNLVRHPLFETLVIMFILTNCVTLALDDPTEDPKSWYNITEIIFTVAFTLEMVLKTFAFGFVLHPHAYLRSPWNRLDFIIVCLSYLNFVPGFGNYTMIRTMRVLRPLRSMNAVPGLKMIVNALFYSVRGLVHVLYLGAFIFMVYGILGVQLWGGLLRYRCYDPVEDVVIDNRFCKTGNTYHEWWGRNCDEGHICKDVGNPNFGYTSFDHIGWAFLTIFQCITMEGWSDIMYATFEVWGVMASVYFVLLVVIGSYFVLNLALAVINEEFSMICEKEASLYRTASEFRIADTFKSFAQSFRKVRSNADNASKSDELEMSSSIMSSSMKRKSVIGGVSPTTPPPITFRPAFVEEKDGADEQQQQQQPTPPPTPSHRRLRRIWRHRIRRLRQYLRVVIDGPKAFMGTVQAPKQSRRQSIAAAGLVAGNINATSSDENDNGDSVTIFNRFIIFCIVLNTVILAVEHHDQPDIIGSISEVCNIIFTVIFGVEMVLKIFAFGLKEYASDGFNFLDGTVVIVSIVELFLAGSSTTSAFRALRLLRVFKLMKSFPALRNLIEVIMSAVAETGYLNLICLLYLFIASLVGMQFFGGKFRQFEAIDGEPIRSTFDSFYWSFLTIFQILNRDAWPNVMWNGMRATGEPAAIYFIGLVLCGDF